MKRTVRFILDEAAALGRLPQIDDAIDKYRGYGVRLDLYYQSLGQLKQCFPNGQDQSLLSNTSQVFFGVNDTATADYVSARLGEKTIIVDSGGSSTGTSQQAALSAQPHSSSTTSDNRNSGWQQQARKLLKPEEVIGLPPRTAITFTPGVPPICTTLLRYYEQPKLGRRSGWLRSASAASATLMLASALFAMSAGIAFALTVAISGHRLYARRLQQPGVPAHVVRDR